MDPVRIAHLSDLHFGCDDQQSVWESLKCYLIALKPELVLVTGDIVDSPSKKAFEVAAAQLRLAAPGRANHQGFYVCPGNHDRYWRGNAFGKFAKGLTGIIGRRKTSDSWFDASFAVHLVSASPGLILDLPASGKGWKVKLVGLDSSRDAAHLAQGFIHPQTLEELQQHTDGEAMKKVDLFIVLMHHHLLPIPELETATHRFGAAAVKAGTLMDNAGSALAALTKAQVDIVLHGHEHQRHIARFGSLSEELSDLVVVGASSASGAVTGKPCRPGSASFNVIELRPDRTVWVVEHRWNGTWGAIAGAVRLFNHKNLRRSGFLRRAERERRHTSDVAKHVVFTRGRNAIVRERRTDLLIEGGAWNLVARNTTGEPATPRVSIQADRPVRWHTSGGFVKRRHEDHAYIYEIEFDDPEPLFVSRMDIEYQWLNGVLLDKRDSALFESGILGVFRRDGMEFVASTVSDHIRSLTLSVSFPDGFSPDESTLEVWSENLPENESPERFHALTRTLLCNGDGVFTVAIPYPKRGFRYFLAWPLPDRIEPTASHERTEALARRAADRLATAFLQAFAGTAWARLSTAAVYLARSPCELERIGIHSGDARPEATAAIPRLIDLRKQHGLYLHAWWGDEGIGIAERDGNVEDAAKAQGLLDGEKVLATLPLRVGEYAPRSPPLGIVRVALRWDPSIDGHFSVQSTASVRELRDRLAEGRVLLLNALLSARQS